MSEENSVYGNVKQEKKTEQILIRITPTAMRNFKRKAFEDHRRPAELARALVERHADR